MRTRWLSISHVSSFSVCGMAFGLRVSPNSLKPGQFTISTSYKPSKPGLRDYQSHRRPVANRPNNISLKLVTKSGLQLKDFNPAPAVRDGLQGGFYAQLFKTNK